MFSERQADTKAIDCSYLSDLRELCKRLTLPIALPLVFCLLIFAEKSSRRSGTTQQQIENELDIASRCRVQMIPFSQIIGLNDGDGFIQISADKACSSRIGRPFELENVRMRLLKKNSTIMEVNSRSAIAYLKQSRIYFDTNAKIIKFPSPNYAQSKTNYFKSGFLVDWTFHEVRSPNGYYYKL